MIYQKVSEPVLHKVTGSRTYLWKPDLKLWIRLNGHTRRKELERGVSKGLFKVISEDQFERLIEGSK